LADATAAAAKQGRNPCAGSDAVIPA